MGAASLRITKRCVREGILDELGSEAGVFEPLQRLLPNLRIVIGLGSSLQYAKDYSAIFGWQLPGTRARETSAM
jgi:hypothetical protein